MKKSFLFQMALLGSFFYLMSCAPTVKMAYKPNPIDGKQIEIPVSAQVNVKNTDVSAIANKTFTEEAITKVLIEDFNGLFTNLGPIAEYPHDLNLKITVNDIAYKTQPWGLIWFPLMFVGAPIVRDVGKSDISVSLTSPIDNNVVKQYNSSKKVAKWVGLFYGLKYENLAKPTFVTYLAMNHSIDEIKKNIQNDRQELDKYWLTKNPEPFDEFIVDYLNPDKIVNSSIGGIWKMENTGTEFEIQLDDNGFKFKNVTDPNSYALFRLIQAPAYVCYEVQGSNFPQAYVGSSISVKNSEIELFNNQNKGKYKLNKIKTSEGKTVSSNNIGSNVNSANNTSKVEKKFNPKTGAFEYSVTKEHESEKIRQDWLSKGGWIGVNSFGAGYNYLNFKKDGIAMVGNGLIGNLSANFINLKMPDINKIPANWSSFVIGMGIAGSYTNSQTEYDAGGTNEITEVGVASYTMNLNLGLTLGLGAFLSDDNWKGVAIDLTYRPSFVSSKVVSEDIENAEAQQSFNPAGFGIDFTFSNFKSSMEKIAPKAASKLGFFFLPQTSKTPLMFNITYGIVWYQKRGK